MSKGAAAVVGTVKEVGNTAVEAVKKAAPVHTEDYAAIMSLGTTKAAMYVGGKLKDKIQNKGGGPEAVAPVAPGTAASEITDRAPIDVMTQVKEAMPGLLRTYFYNPRIK